MSGKIREDEKKGLNTLPMAVLNAIQNPVILVNESGYVAFANWEAEAFFGASSTTSPSMISAPSFHSAARC